MANGIRKAFQTGRQNYNKLSLLKKAKDVAFDGGKKNKPQPKSKTPRPASITSQPGSKGTSGKNSITNYNKIPDMATFRDKQGTVYTYDSTQRQWISRDGKATLDPKRGAAAYNKAKEKSKLESKDQTMKKNVKEGLADMAGRVDQDHEIQMARSDLYKLAEYAIKLHDMLKSIPEEQGIEAWQQAKITKASDYISSVFHSLDYDQKFPPANTGSAVAMNDMPTAEGKYKSDAQRKAVHAAKNAKAKKESADPYLTILRQQLSEKAESKDQQRAAGIALKHKREGTKPPKGSASEEMMKMSTKELEKFAGTKHKGLPKDKS